MQSPPFSTYAAGASFDECLRPDGSRRGPWNKIAQDFDALGAHGLAQRWKDGRRQLRENGVTYTMLSDASGERPWRLDAIPVAISRSEWDQLTPGLIQRAQLLEQMLSDCYGDRQLIRDGLLPPATVFGHPGFLRPCHNVPAPGGHYLHLLAIDLLRDTDGRWVVSNHRCEAPSGFGYALENRLVVSRTFPSIYHTSHVERLAGFFGDMLNHWRSLAVTNQDQPRVVLLEPSSTHRSAFENAYLARYLNISVVQGQDLTVRDDGVFLKTIGELVPIDVIVRRVSDRLCDPLALDVGSSEGTAGLLNAARRGQVVIVNGLGSSLADNGAWLPLLPNICQHLLGQPLLLDSIPTWWGGTDLTHIAREFNNCLVKSAFDIEGHSPQYPATLPETQRQELLAAVHEQPNNYIAQPDIAPSTTPIWTKDGLSSRPVVIRAYLLRNGESFQVMPGGLARVSTDDSHTSFAMHDGALAKDLWIVSDQPVIPESRLPTKHQPLALRRAVSDVPSRIADNLFWLGRYAERAENTARMLRLWAMRSNRDDENLHAVERALFALRPGLHNNRQHILSLLTDAQAMDSIPRLISALQRTALASRDRLSDDTWRLANQMIDSVPSAPLEDPISVLDKIILQLSAFAGMAFENTVRSLGWTFMELGRRLERADYICSSIPAMLLSTTKPSGVDSHGHRAASVSGDTTQQQLQQNGQQNGQQQQQQAGQPAARYSPTVPSFHASTLVSMLELHDSIITYRTRYLTIVQLPAVTDLLITDGSNPRSLAFQIEQMSALIDQLPNTHNAILPSPAQRIISRLNCELTLADPYDLSSLTDASGLASFTTQVTTALSDLSDQLTSLYLAHTAVTRNLGRIRSREG